LHRDSCIRKDEENLTGGNPPPAPSANSYSRADEDMRAGKQKTGIIMSTGTMRNTWRCLLLCVCDAYFTLKIIHYGGKELNPLMIKFLDKFPEMSLFLKYVITAISLIILLIHKNFILFGKVKAYFFLYVIFALYFLLVSYEVSFFYFHTR